MRGQVPKPCEPTRLHPRVRLERARLQDIPSLVEEALRVARSRMSLSGLLTVDGMTLPGDFALWTEEEALRIAKGLTSADCTVLERVASEGELGAVIAPLAPLERLTEAHRRVLPDGTQLVYDDWIRFRGTHGVDPSKGLAIRGFTLGLGEVGSHLRLESEERLSWSLEDRIKEHAHQNSGEGQGLTLSEYLALQEDRLGAEPLDAQVGDGPRVATVLNGEIESTSVLIGFWERGVCVQERLLSSTAYSSPQPRHSAFRPWVRMG